MHILIAWSCLRHFKPTSRTLKKSWKVLEFRNSKDDDQCLSFIILLGEYQYSKSITHIDRGS